MAKRQFVIVGAGPAGLTAAYELLRHGLKPTVLEKSHTVGGIARTENYKGFHFDMGGHRFFTKSKEVNDLWFEILADDFLLRPRKSRIYYNNRFFDYPLKMANVLSNLGIVTSGLIFLSWVKWQIFPYRQENTFEEWVTNRFGKRLFLTFFKTYTEKVWGISCSELKAEWAAQRIKGLSMKTAIASMFFKSKTTIKTLIEEFHYPRQGPGMMWKAATRVIEQQNGTVRKDSDVVKILRDGLRINGVVVADEEGREETIPGTDFISSMPVNEFIKKLDPAPPKDVLEAAHQLKHRDFLTVCIIVNRADLFDDNWIYIHDSAVEVGRIQNFKNWSPDMVPDASKSSLGLEYFCNEGDEVWTRSDADLIEQGKRELEHLGLARIDDCEDGCVFRVAKSYPIYDADYQTHLDCVKGYMQTLENCQTIGRNGLHRYNNQDHSMLTALYAVRNMVQGTSYDVWNVNAEQEYHETIEETGSDDGEAKPERPPSLVGDQKATQSP